MPSNSNPRKLNVQDYVVKLETYLNHQRMDGEISCIWHILLYLKLHLMVIIFWPKSISRIFLGKSEMWEKITWNCFISFVWIKNSGLLKLNFQKILPFFLFHIFIAIENILSISWIIWIKILSTIIIFVIVNYFWGSKYMGQQSIK